MATTSGALARALLLGVGTLTLARHPDFPTVRLEGAQEWIEYFVRGSQTDGCEEAVIIADGIYAKIHAEQRVKGYLCLHLATERDLATEDARRWRMSDPDIFCCPMRVEINGTAIDDTRRLPQDPLVRHVWESARYLLGGISPFRRSRYDVFEMRRVNPQALLLTFEFPWGQEGESPWIFRIPETVLESATQLFMLRQPM